MTRHVSAPVVRLLNRADYVVVWKAMQAFNTRRDEATPDEIWVVEHPPVFTLGLNGKREHVLDPGDIPVVRCDRGGQVTYHGPGQVVIYLLLDLKRLALGAHELVSVIEAAIIAFLADQGIAAEARPKAPGVYVDGRKISALGLRIRRGCSYHGLAFNVDMDLSPFKRINPCGYAGLEVTHLKEHVAERSWHGAADGLCARVVERLGYNDVVIANQTGDIGNA